MISSFGVPLVVLGIIVVVHELGHFLVAKLFRIEVETFSVGFGPRLFGFRYRETDYRLSMFPLGGYVKMSGMNPGESGTETSDGFLSKPKWQRFLVAAAGPAMNIVLSVALLTSLFIYGTEVPEFNEGDAIVGVVETGSAADRAGIQPGDRIVAIAGKHHLNWEEIEARVLTNAGQGLQVVLNRAGDVIETLLTPIERSPNKTGYAGMQPRIRFTNVINRVEPGSVALAAGLKKGDEIVAVNGVDLMSSAKSFSEIIQSIPDSTFPLIIRRNGARLDVSVSPVRQDGRRMIGVGLGLRTVIVKESFSEALTRSLDRNIEDAVLIVQVFRKLITGQASMRSLDGPLSIMKATGDFYEAGFGPLLILMSMISLNLGLMNLLPIPLLDGGLMLMLAIECLMGRDLSLRLKERAVQLGLVFLLTLMVFVLYNDVMKLKI